MEEFKLMSLRNIAAAALLGFSLLFNSGCNTEQAPVKKVASIDETAIYEMDMFKTAQADLKKWIDEEGKKAQEKVKDKSDEEKAKAYQEYQAAVEIKTNETLKPLKDKARAAVATAAAKKGIEVILDKKIVVYGVDDLTEETKSILSGGGEITFPEEKEGQFDKAPIGYFEPDVVRSLKVFKEAQVEILQERNRLLKAVGEQIEKARAEGKEPSPAEIQALQKQVEARLGALEEQKMGPLIKAVTDSVEEVAKAEGLALVLDTQHVMYSGRNLTELVVDTFLKKVSGGAASGGDSAEPAATATPAPAGE